MLLWHGSRLSNWVGILSHGLRIAPPEAPITGYMVSRNWTLEGGTKEKDTVIFSVLFFPFPLPPPIIGLGCPLTSIKPAHFFISLFNS